MESRPRSAGVTAAATYAILCCITIFLVWGFIFLTLLNLPRDDHGRSFFEQFPLPSLLFAFGPPAVIAAGVRTAVGLLHLKPWARRLSLVWAAIITALCLGLIALRPFETFVIPRHFVNQIVLTRQITSISFVFMLLPVSVWWLFYFRTEKVKRQFLPPAESAEDTAVASEAEKV